jgi:hypothetical protein
MRVAWSLNSLPYLVEVARTLSESALPSIGWMRLISDEPSMVSGRSTDKAMKRFVRGSLTMLGKVRFTGRGQFQATGSSGVLLNSLVVRTEMLDFETIRPAVVTGPLGERMTRADLPPRNTLRWVARRKAEVVAAVNGGLLSIREACERYDLTLEEFASWQRAVEREGLPGLRISRAQAHRDLVNRKMRH